MGRILLIEDSPDSQLIARRALEDMAEVIIAGNIENARKLLEANEFDVLLVDVALPDGDGFGFCTTLLAGAGGFRPKIMFLTGKGALEDKLTGFSVGGDDYLVKPVDPLELRARVQAQLRSCREAVIHANVLRAGNLKLDISAHSACLASGITSMELDLTPTEFKLLHQLAKNPGQVYSREQLLQSLKGGKVHVTDRTVDAHLCRVRKKLAACTHNVEPIYGVGYRFSKKAA